MTSNQRQFNSGKFTLKMDARPVGQIDYLGPNTPRNTEEDLSFQNETAISTDGYTDAEDSSSSSGYNNTYTTLMTDRPGRLEVVPQWLGVTVTLKDYFLAAIGAIVYAASEPTDDKLEGFDINLVGFGACLRVEPWLEETDAPFRYRDAINAIVELVSQAVEGYKFEAVAATVYWLREGHAAVTMGRIWVAPKPPGGCPEGASPVETL